MTYVRAALGAGFKRCCLKNGHHDGSNRDYFFPGVESSLRMKRKGGSPEIHLTFAFCSPIVRGGRGNGKRPRGLQNRTRGKAATGSIAFQGSHEPVAVR